MLKIEYITLLTVQEISERLGVCERTTRDRIRNGSIRAVKIGSDTYITARELKRREHANKWLSVQDAAALLDCTTNTIRAYISAGKFAAKRGQKNKYLISYQSILSYLEGLLC